MKRCRFAFLCLATAAGIVGFGCSQKGTGGGGTGGAALTTATADGTTATGATTANGTATANGTTNGATTTGAMTTGATTGSGTPGGLFTAAEPWTKDVSGLLPSNSSNAIINELAASGGWGTGTIKIDFSIPLFFGNNSTPVKTITGASGYCYGGTDCDPVPLQMPLPANGNAENSATYVCDTANSDCHILVVQTDQKKLYELYNATQTGNGFTALGAFVWDLTKAYPDNERGDQCTSADAAGFPVAGLLPTADEVKAGDVHHALRFVLPNPEMRAGVYVHPASHAGAPSSNSPNAPPDGVRLRLKAGTSEASFNAGEKVIIHAMKTYGMLLSDGGNYPLTFADDRTTATKWADVGITGGSFGSLSVTDFEVVDLGPDVVSTQNCVRNP